MVVADALLTRLGPLALGCALSLACDPPAPPATDPGAVPEPADPLRPVDQRGHLPDTRIADYVLDARLDAEEHTVTGTARITWRNTSKNPSPILRLHLYMNAFRAEDTAWMLEARGSHRGSKQDKDEGRWGYIDLRAARLLGQGAPGSLTQLETGAAAPTLLTWTEDAEPSLATLTLPRAVAPGEAVTVELDFFTRLPRVFARTGYEGDFHMVAQWYPKLGVLHDKGWRAHPFTLFSEFYADFGDYEVHLDVPEDMVVGATGVLADEAPPEAGRKRLTFKATMVHDFAWAASPDFVEYRDVWRGVRIRQLLPRALAADVTRHADALVATLESMDRRFGPYPWSTITVIHPPADASGAQGMEYPTLFTTSDIFHPPLPIRALGLRELLTGTFTTIHEFGHQYFQGLLASDEFSQPWLDEGLNNFSNSLVLRDWLGEDASIAAIGDQRISHADNARTALNFGSDLDAVDRPADSYRDISGTYGNTVYRKTSALLNTLRNLAGPEAFDRAFRGYTEAWRFRHPTGADLEAALVEGLGAKVRIDGTGPEGQPIELDVRDFLEQALRTTAEVDFAVERVVNRRPLRGGGYHRDKEGHLALTELPDEDADLDPKDARDGFVLVARRGEFRLPVDVLVEFEDGETERFTWDGQERYRLFTWPRRRVRRVTLDPDEKLWLEAKRLDNDVAAPGTDLSDGLSDPLARASEAAHLMLLGGFAL